MKDKIFLYADKDSPVSDDVPSISMPYKDLKQFRRENPEFNIWASYSINSLMKAWGVADEVKKLKELLEEACNLVDELGRFDLDYTDAERDGIRDCFLNRKDVKEILG